MFDNLPDWARALTIEFRLHAAPDGEEDIFQRIRDWGLMDIPDRFLPPAEIIENPDGVPKLKDANEVPEWRHLRRRKIKKHVVRKLRESRTAAAEGLDRVEEKLDAIHWLENACVQSEHQLQARIDDGSDVAERYSNTLLQYGQRGDNLEDLERVVQALKRSLQESELSEQIGLEMAPERRLSTELGRALEAQNRIKILRGTLDKIPRVKALLKLRHEVYSEAVNHVESGGNIESLLPAPPPYSDPVNEYLQLAYYWYKRGNQCDGDKPTKLWDYLAKQTGKQREAPMQAFRRKGWYDPHAEPPPREHTRRSVLEEGKKHFVES